MEENGLKSIHSDGLLVKSNEIDVCVFFFIILICVYIFTPFISYINSKWLHLAIIMILLKRII